MTRAPEGDRAEALRCATTIVDGPLRKIRFAKLEDGSFPCREVLLSLLGSKESRVNANGLLALLKHLSESRRHPRFKPWPSKGVEDLRQITSGDLRMILVERRDGTKVCLDAIHVFSKHERTTPRQDAATVKRLYKQLGGG